MAAALINPTPLVHERRETTRRRKTQQEQDEEDEEEEQEIMAKIKYTMGNMQKKKNGRGVQRKGVAMLYAFANAERGRHRACNEEEEEEEEEREAMDTDHVRRDEGEERDAIDALEVFEHVRDIRDPEHPYSLEQLSVVGEDRIKVDDEKGRVSVSFTPTVQHCSMATLIGLSLRVKLMRVLPPRFKVDVRVSPGSHASESAVNKQLNDKERVCAALENPNLVDMVMSCIGGGGEGKEKDIKNT